MPCGRCYGNRIYCKRHEIGVCPNFYGLFVGWREFKVGAYAKRCRGLFALPSEWATRTLPEPSVVAAFTAIADKEEFQELCHKQFLVLCNELLLFFQIKFARHMRRLLVRKTKTMQQLRHAFPRIRPPTSFTASPDCAQIFRSFAKPCPEKHFLFPPISPIFRF